ncbi:(-)-isopiperitenol/(-)-carveol dehydrogenase, mitochondrial [Ricinus communis]|uniref:Short chain alcohol dehydrogenase, putative n=1 Tax=Ricinus communis TaxID=3988 RepID=B9R937_RICCO|nr:(-)-isopiperitenol/(-)-carveol dehydrogenase, mitochondrial [Ricinus communis]EEF52114.1 short chain alcohol dehydrogenase, putative [Ricinus communis]|eukprot:XP_015578708.1 (-)-isopiperitenol/(-)-carveol dehydrogenase, mitochondrial [Ricinus communis]
MATTTPSSNDKLQDKVAIITGGASSIGEATVHQFAKHGARAVVIADVQDEKGRKLAESIGTDRSTYIHCDLTDENQVKSLIETTMEMYGQLDIMFCNAGIFSSCIQNVLEFDMAAYEKLFAVNVGGVAASLKHAARAMVEGGVKGSIICTSSIAASTGGDRAVDYIMFQSAVLALMRSASKQLGEHGIRVNCVSPGAVATPLTCKDFGMETEEDVEKAFESSYWLKGVMKVKHVTDAVLFLACQDSEFITGHNLVVDGGFKF